MQHSISLEGELYDNIINDIHQEFSRRQIAEKYSVSIYHIRKMLQHHLLNPCEKCKNIGRQPYRSSSDSIQKRREIVLELFQSGMPCLKIANKLKFCYETILCDVRALGLKPVLGQPAKTQRNNAVVECCRSGMTTLKIAEQFGISDARVSQIITNYNKTAEQPVSGLLCQLNRFACVQKRREKVLELFQSGMSCQKIAAQLHFSGVLICRDVRALGLKPAITQPKTPRNAEIVKCRRSKMPIRKIAERFGLSIGRVSCIIKRYNKTAK
jgi:DNA-binding CsgD family transcriptional regulator